MLLTMLKSVEIRHDFNPEIVQYVDEVFKPIGFVCELDGCTGYIDVQDRELDLEFEDAVQEVVAMFGSSVVSLHF